MNNEEHHAIRTAFRYIESRAGVMEVDQPEPYDFTTARFDALSEDHYPYPKYGNFRKGDEK